ncbi:MAG TPA: hypothetical protein VKY74_18940, partial [Chloroflexia bacterium]|nr:hypothetical protein [Chloroflexia bacterium]
ISATDLERLTQLEEERRQRFAVLERIWTLFQDVPPAEIEQEVAQAIRQVRAAHAPPAPGDPGAAS